jgi:hypothetical protein
MGTQQVLRAAAVVAITATASFGASIGIDSAWADAGQPPASQGTPVVVVDLTASASVSGAEVVRRELKTAGFTVISAPDLDAANAGIEGGKDLTEAMAALELARTSFGELDCPAATAAAESAIALLAARGAAGIDVSAPLSTAWSYLLLCRDRSGDFDGAMRAAQALRTLAPTGAARAGQAQTIDAALWSKYPEVDATANHEVAELAISVDAGADPDASIWIDHRPAGTSPAKVLIPAGRHIIAAAKGSRRAAIWIDVVSPRPASVAIRLFEQDAPLARVSDRVAAWKTQPPGGQQVADYLENLLTAAQGRPWNPSSHRSPLLVIVGASGDPKRAQLWASDGPGLPPTVTEVAFDPTAPAPLVTAAQQRTTVWQDRSADPDNLMVEERTEKLQLEEPSSGKKQWWVYAALAGAVVVGGAVILVNEFSDDTQRVELRW